MPLATRLSGDTDRAAMWWGEAKRVLFQLKNDLQYTGVECGWRSRTCFDKTIIRVGSLNGVDIVEINSPFIRLAEKKRYEPALYIICIRNIDFDLDDSFKIYSIKSKDGAIVTEETNKTPTQFLFHLVDSDTGTAPGIISKPTRVEDFLIRKDHVVSRGLNYEDWLITQNIGSVFWNMNITYEDRYLYTKPFPDPDYGTVFQMAFRMVNGFRITGGRSSFYNPHLYFPKLVDGNPVWTVLDHNTYAGTTDVIGKNNITLDTDKRYAKSWGERICEQENAPYTFNVNGSTDLSSIHWFGRYSWPIIGTLNARKVPKIYSMKYKDDDGTQTTEDYWTETLSYAETGGNGSGSGVTYWPIAAIGNKKFLYLKNSLEQETTNSFVEDWSYPEIWSGEGPAGTSSASSSCVEDITQEFYAGDTLIESLVSNIEKTYSRDIVIVATGVWPIGTYSEIIEETFTATYRWAEVLDYSNHQGNSIVFYKKITEVISWPRSYSNSGAYSIMPPNRVVTDSRIGTSTRKVEYYLATIIDGVLTKRLLETFDGSCDTEMSFIGEDDGVDITGTRICTSEEDGVGERIYGVSCQMNKDYAVFSFNKETFGGTGANATDYFKAKISTATASNFNWFGDGLSNTDPMPYPSPLEDMNLILDTETEAWVDGKFCVGAIGIGKNEGIFGYSEFDNQTDIVAATGLLDILRRVE